VGTVALITKTPVGYEAELEQGELQHRRAPSLRQLLRELCCAVQSQDAEAVQPPLLLEETELERPILTISVQTAEEDIRDAVARGSAVLLCPVSGAEIRLRCRST
jgi:hypothetical protein